MRWTIGPDVFAAISPACLTAAMVQKKKGPSIGRGRQSPPEDAFEAPAEKPPMPPLAMPQAIGDTELYALLARYDLRPLLPISTFEHQLVQVIAGLEKRLLELAPDL